MTETHREEAAAMPEPKLQRTVKAVIYPSEGMYVAECVGISAVTQGATIDEALRNLQDAVSLYLEDEDPREFGLTPDPTIVVTIEMELARSAA